MISFIEKHKVMFSIVLLLVFVASMYSMDLNRVTSTSAAISLFKGEARQYKNEQLIREELYLSEDKNIVVDELTVKPYVLYFWDIADSDDGRYEQMETGYNNCKYSLLHHRIA